MKKFNVILADPPWNYSDKAQAGKRGSSFHYEVMKQKDIEALPVSELAADNCALFLWTTGPMMPNALSVMKAWGFKFKNMAFTWVKMTENGLLFWGMGNWTRSNPEFCLLGVKGKPKRESAAVHSVILQSRPTGRIHHSEKPTEIRERIVKLMGDVPRVELFARQIVEGWDCWGNEVESTIDLYRHLAKSLKEEQS